MEEKEMPMDLIWGLEEIGKLINRNYQQTHHMVKSGRLPVVKQMGGRYCVSRRALVAFFMGETA